MYVRVDASAGIQEILVQFLIDVWLLGGLNLVHKTYFSRDNEIHSDLEGYLCRLLRSSG